MRKSVLKSVGRVCATAVVLSLGLLMSKGQASAATGSFTVTGGTEGVDYDYTYDSTAGTYCLTIKTGTAMTVTGTAGYRNCENQNKEYICIDAATDVNLTINTLKIDRGYFYNNGSNVYGPAIKISDSYSKTATINITGKNVLRGRGGAAIEKNGSNGTLILQGNGTLTAYSKAVDNIAWPAVIGGGSGSAGSNIIFKSGTYTLTAYSGGAAIGGGLGGEGSDITIGELGAQNSSLVINTTLEADSNTQFSTYGGAAIGGGGKADGSNITINSGTINITKMHAKTYGGAAIGGGCFGSGKNIVINGGAITAITDTANYCGAAIGGGYKIGTVDVDWSSGNTITITGGTITATSAGRAPAIGSYGTDQQNDDAVIYISGGTINAKCIGTSSYAPGIGGGFYSSAHVYISGGNVYAKAGESKENDVTASAVGLEAHTAALNRYECVVKHGDGESDDAVAMQTVTDSNYASSPVDVIIVEAEDESKEVTGYYGINDMNADSTGTVYVYLPSKYKLKGLRKPGVKTVTIPTVSWDYSSPFTYDGKSHSVNLTADTISSIPTGLTYTVTGNTGTAAGDYTAKVTFAASSGVEISNAGLKEQTIGWKINPKQVTIPTAVWNYTDPIDYDGLEHTVSLTADFISGLPEGVKFDPATGYSGVCKATTVGAYTAKATFTTASTNYSFANSSLATQQLKWIIQDVPISVKDIGWDYSTPFTFDGKSHTVALLLTEEQKDGLYIDYSSSKNAVTQIAKGNYSATAVLSARPGYKIIDGDYATKTLSWSINEYVPDDLVLKYNNADKKDWYNSSVSITAAGYEIGTSPDGTFSSSIKFTDSETKSLFFKNTTTGYITTSGRDVSVKIDTDKPTGSISLDGKSFTTRNNLKEKKKYHLASFAVTLTGVDSGDDAADISGLSKLEYAVVTNKDAYTTEAAIEAAGLSWSTTGVTKAANGSMSASYTFPSDVIEAAVYLKLTDTAGNVTYVSTPVLSNDSSKPVIGDVRTDNITESTVDVSFIINKSSEYSYVVTDEADSSLTTVSAIKDAINSGKKGGTGEGTAFSGSVTGLSPNKTYYLYIAASDGLTTLSGTANPNVADGVNKSFTTSAKSITVADQTAFVKAGKSGNYTYDLKDMLKSSVGDITQFSIQYGAETASGNITSGGLSVSADGVLTIPLKAGFTAGQSQDITVTFNLGSEYKQASAKLTVKAVAADVTEVYLASPVAVASAEYTGNAVGIATENIVWKDSANNQIISGISSTITYKKKSDDDYVDISGNNPPTEVGRYRVVVTANKASYVGTKTFDYEITKKDLSASFEWYFDDEKYDASKTYNSDDSTHTVTIRNYDATLIKPVYTTKKSNGASENTNSETQAGTYETTASFEFVTGVSENNYKLPSKQTLIWQLKEIETEVIDLANIDWDWQYMANGVDYGSDESFVADGTTYKVELKKPYPAGIKSISYIDGEKSEAGTYDTTAVFEVTDSEKYVVKGSKTLHWSIKAKTDNRVIPSTDDVQLIYSQDDEVRQYLESTRLMANGKDYIVYAANLPAGVRVASYKGVEKAASAGSYKLTVNFEIDEAYAEVYKTPEPKVFNWIIYPSEDGDDPEQAPIKWIYSQGESSGDYNSDTKLVENGQPYSVSVTDLPEGIEVLEYTGVREATNAGDYTVKVSFSLIEGYDENTAVPEDMELTWKIYSKDVSQDDPKPQVPAPAPSQDTGVAPTSGPVLAEVGSIQTYSGAVYKVLTSSEAGGTVEYEGQEKVNKKTASVSIPQTVVIGDRSYTVTAVKNGAFSGYSKLKKVTMGSGITKIGDKAFYKCTSLKSVIIPAGVTSIGKQAFYGCKKLSKITIKTKVLKTVGKNAIKGINKKAKIKCPNKKLKKKYKKLFKSKTGYKKTMKIS